MRHADPPSSIAWRIMNNRHDGSIAIKQVNVSVYNAYVSRKT
jgi:hypothetical protein